MNGPSYFCADCPFESNRRCIAIAHFVYTFGHKVVEEKRVLEDRRAHPRHETGDLGFEEAMQEIAREWERQGGFTPEPKEECTNHFSDGSKMFPNQDCCQRLEPKEEK